MGLHWKFNPLGIGGLMPLINTRGVFITSGATVIQSAMTITGGTIGTDYPGNRMDVYNRGRAVDTVVYSGGTLTVSSGGVASEPTVSSGGYIHANVGGVARAATISSDGNVVVYSGGRAEGSYADGGTIVVSRGGIASNCSSIHNMRDGQINVYAGGTAYDIVVSSGGRCTANNGIISGLTILQSASYCYLVGSAVAYNVVEYYGRLSISAGGCISGLTMNANTNKGVSSGSVVEAVTLNAGTMTVLESGIVSSAVVSSGTRLIVSSGGLASNFSSVDGATVQVLSGGSATIRGAIAYGVSVSSGGALTVESGGVLHIQSTLTAYGVTVESGGSARTSRGCSSFDMNILSGGSVAVLTGAVVSGYTVGGTANVYGKIYNATITADGQMNIWTNASATSTTVTGSIMVLSGIINETVVFSGGIMAVSAGGIVNIVDVNNGGSMTVSSGGSALDVVNEPDAVIDSQAGATVTYAQPIAGSQGIYAYSLGALISSAMVMSGDVIGAGLNIDTMNVYNRGRALSITTSQGALLSVASGGIATNVTSSTGSVITYVPGGTVTYANADTIYGVEYNPSNSSPVCQKVVLRNGTITQVADFTALPAHNWNRCVMDNLANRHINYYLDPTDSTKKLNGTAADLTGADGDVMVEIPVVYWRVDELPDGKVRWLVSDHTFDGAEPHPFFKVSPDGNTVRTQYVGAYQATICDANGDRIANMMNESATAPTSYNSAYKLRSVAGCKPYTNTNMANMRTNAHNNGGNLCNSLFYQFLGLMMLIEGGSLNTQETISEGFSFASTWNYAFTRLSGRTNAGNGTAETLADATLDAAITWNASHAKHVIGFQYRGIENPYGQVWQFEEGFQKWNDVTWNYVTVNSVQYNRNASLDNGTNRAWTNASNETLWTTTLYPQSVATYTDNTCTTPSGYNTANNANGATVHDGEYWYTTATNNYTSTDQHSAASPVYTRVAHEWTKEGYPKAFNHRTFFPTSTGGGTTTYMCDYFYNSVTNIVTRCGLRGGTLNYGLTDGAWYVNVSIALSSSNAHIGCRLSA